MDTVGTSFANDFLDTGGPPAQLSRASPVSRRWRVDRIHCHLLGQSFSGFPLGTEPHLLSLPRPWQVWTELITVSICHQANWDKLHSTVMALAASDVSQIGLDRLARITGGEFRRLFGAAYDADRIRAGERASLLRSLAEAMETNSDGPTFRWLGPTSVPLGGTSGLYNWLRRIEAFRDDPLQKKSRIFVHDLLRHELITVADPENIAPAVDYHLIRLYVRTGRVLPIRVDLFDRLSEQGTPRVEFHSDLRAAVEEAMTYTASGADLRIDQLNHIEWQIARSFCTRSNPRCDGPPLPEKPIDKTLAQLARGVGGCPICRDCRGAKDEELRMIVDPRSASAYY